MCVHKSWSCLKLNGYVYAYVDVEVFSRFIVKRYYIIKMKHVEMDKCTKNKLCNKLTLFTRLYRDAWAG